MISFQMIPFSWRAINLITWEYHMHMIFPRNWINCSSCSRFCACNVNQINPFSCFLFYRVLTSKYRQKILYFLACMIDRIIKMLLFDYKFDAILNDIGSAIKSCPIKLKTKCKKWRWSCRLMKTWHTYNNNIANLFAKKLTQNLHFYSRYSIFYV